MHGLNIFNAILMDIKIAIDGLIAKMKVNASIVLVAAVSNAVGKQKRRIFNDGQSATAGDIGNYSTDKMYADADDFAVKSKFKPAKNRKTVKLDDGYKELREIQGFQTDKVDLMYTGALFTSQGTGTKGMRNAFQYEKESEFVIAVGFTNKLDANKAKGNEKHFGKVIFQLNKKEIVDLEAEIKTLLLRAIG